MTVVDDFAAAARGRKNWGKDPTIGLDTVLLYLQTAINTAPGSTLELSDVLTANVDTSNDNIVLTFVYFIQV